MKRLSQKDLHLMELYRDRVLNYDKKPQLPVNDILEKVYYKAKEPLYKLLGNSYTLSVPFTYHKNFECMENEVYHKLLDHHISEFYVQYHDWSQWYENEYEKYIKDCLAHTVLMTAMSTPSLVANELSPLMQHLQPTIKCPNGKNFKVHTTMKLMRFFSKIVKAFPGHFTKEAFEEFRVQHSIICTNKEYNNTLTLSIHPLDFWTMSDNASNWSSCMSWVDEGGYRAGTVEMMNSPCVVMAYLEGTTPYYISPTDTWNNKIWRELYVVTGSIITSVRAYPYDNPELSKYVIGWLGELAEKNLGFKYEEAIGDFEGYGGCVFYHDDKRYRIFFECERMYNDFDTEYKHYTKFALDPLKYLGGTTMYDIESKQIDFSINYSGEMQCMICGDTEMGYEPEYSNKLICFDCAGTVSCVICEEETDDWIESAEGYFYCHNCYGECQICGKEDEYHTAYLSPTEIEQMGGTLPEHYSTLSIYKVCTECYRKYLDLATNITLKEGVLDNVPKFFD